MKRQVRWAVRGMSNDNHSRLRARLLAGTALMGFWLVVLGPPPSLFLSSSQRAEYVCLLNAGYLAAPAVGPAGVGPPQARAFVNLANARGGGTVMKYVLLRGSAIARIYALIGLRRTNPIFCSIVIQPFRFSRAKVKTNFGCFGNTQQVCDLVVSDGAVQLRRGETLARWLRRTPRVLPQLDIVGGGYTSMFFDFDELDRPAAPLRAGADFGPPRC